MYPVLQMILRLTSVDVVLYVLVFDVISDCGESAALKQFVR